MTHIKITECNFDDPASVVSSFIAEMNYWEMDSWKAMRLSRDSVNPDTYQHNVRAAVDIIFDKYCTKKERPYGRQASFQKPPEYDPEKEHIISVQIESNKNKAFIETEREAVLGGGRFLYVLFRKEGKWLIDNLKHDNQGKCERYIL